MRRALVALALLAAVAAGAAAQEAFYAFRTASMDIEISRHPCSPITLKGPVSMTVYDSNPWIVYTCQDDRVILRRFFNPNDNVRVPVPVYNVQNPGGQLPLPICPVGFVNTKGDGQGCVPPNHPLAR